MTQKKSDRNARLKTPLLIFALIALGVSLDLVSGRRYRSGPLAAGLSHIERKEWEAAIPALSEALRATPQDALARHSLGLAYEAKGWKTPAEQQFEQAAIAATKVAADAYVHLAAIALQSSRKEEAAALLQKSLAIDPQNTEAQKALSALGVLRKPIKTKAF
jgi:Tfp pilus assembly protein PilF